MIASIKSPLIIGHRGASALAPENTLAAFARALDDGAQGIELDVRLASDGVPVIIHDPSLRHTGGRKGHVSGFSSRELAQTDVGSWFNRTHQGMARLQYAKQTVPTLDDYFRFLSNQPNQNAITYVELKTVKRKSSNRELVAAVIKAINSRQFQRRVVVISFNLSAVQLVKELSPVIRTGALFSPRQRATRSFRSLIATARASGADEILLHHLIATRRLLKAAHEAQLIPVVWTVDDPLWIGRARQNWIHALMTNNPAILLNAK